MGKIIIVANRLPVTVGNTIRKSSGGLVSALDAMFDASNMLWVGWPGTYFSKSKDIKTLKQKLIDEFQCYPIFLSQQEVAEYYHGFSNACLWPTLHYFPHYIHYSTQWWDNYVKINQHFADEIAANASDDDTVWIHDYHLFLVPQMLRELNPRLKIGFFLHTPFPSFEIFRCLPHRNEILKGLLGADLIGFHTYGYLRHFRSSLIRLLNIDSDIDIILYKERFCKLGVFPIGINSQQFLDAMQSKKTKKREAIFRDSYKGYKIVLGVERVDYTKGIIRRFEAIEKYLSNQEDKQKVVFIFIGIPTRGEVKEYKELIDQIQQKAGEINGKYSSIEYAPIHFIHKSIPLEDLCALYSIADVAMVTPLIDGMNLVAKEYLACKIDTTGVLLLSEFAGAAEELFNAVSVNPYDIDDVAENLEVALEMSEEEKIHRLKGMRTHVIKHDAAHWAKTFLQELERVPDVENTQINNQTNKMTPEVFTRIETAKKIGFFLDYDGTLREFEDLPQKASPPRETLEIIKSLAAHKNHEVYIISGRKGSDLEGWFKGLDVTLVSEHGYNTLPPRAHQWEIIHSNIDLLWKDNVNKIFTQYVSTTPGSFIEEKTSSLVWHYRKTDPEFGNWKAQQLMGHLLEILTNENVVVHQGKRIVEVSSNQVNKGEALKIFLQKNKYDLVVCAGDDKTDETMFKIKDPRIISIKIGSQETYANYRFLSPELFRNFLTQIVENERHDHG